MVIRILKKNKTIKRPSGSAGRQGRKTVFSQLLTPLGLEGPVLCNNTVETA